MNNEIENNVINKVNDIQQGRNIYDVGEVKKIKDFIVEANGLVNVCFFEKVLISDKAIGYIVDIRENCVVIALMKIFKPISIGDRIQSTHTLFTGKISKENSFGRIIDIFGEDKLAGKTFTNLIDIPIERKNISIMDRDIVKRPLLTGITAIDLMYPIGKGQRQLIIGDKKTGKTQICLDTIVNQKNKNVYCIYVAIGKTKKEVKKIYTELLKYGAMSYTIIITAFNDELAPVLSLTPYFALSLAEEYMLKKYDILVIIDDLKRHAEAYREISLVSGKIPGRDAYPADIFYTHSRLLEKGCQHKDGGSVTILPIIETKNSDITDYISTNVISITDGQIVMSSKNFQKGEKPAINYGLSVSRLGGQVQDPQVKAIGADIRRKLLSFLETRYIYELANVSEMNAELQEQFRNGKEILQKLFQYKYSPRSQNDMIALFNSEIESKKENSDDDNQPPEDNTTPQVVDTPVTSPVDTPVELQVVETVAQPTEPQNIDQPTRLNPPSNKEGNNI